MRAVRFEKKSSPSAIFTRTSWNCGRTGFFNVSPLLKHKCVPAGQSFSIRYSTASRCFTSFLPLPDVGFPYCFGQPARNISTRRSSSRQLMLTPSPRWTRSSCEESWRTWIEESCSGCFWHKQNHWTVRCWWVCLPHVLHYFIHPISQSPKNIPVLPILAHKCI